MCLRKTKIKKNNHNVIIISEKVNRGKKSKGLSGQYVSSDLPSSEPGGSK